ncbi:MAG: CPBP family glutamic-type intramembrane protease [Chlamydiales bacterium]|nr:CPBP family glutamic-type intramembrane protease [Chlamydiales bacterium]
MITAITEKPLHFILTREQAFKVIAVAVATLLTFGSSWAFFAAGLTLFCETALHVGSQHTWYDTRALSFENFIFGIGKEYLGKLVIGVALIALGLVVLPTGPAQTKLAEMALAAPARFFFQAVVQAPICEEIFFRGFLQERFVDMAQLFDRHIHPLSNEFQHSIANLAQAVLFGLAHITGGQVAPGAKWLIAMSTGWSGYVFGSCKRENDELLLSTSLHSFGNFIAASVLLGKS